MRAIDIHTHAFPDSLAPRAIAKLQDSARWRAVLDGRVSSLLASMDAAGVELSVVCPVATKCDQDHTAGIFQWCQEIRSPRIEPFPSVHPRLEGAAGWLERFAAAGFKGVKLHPMYQGFAADEPAAMELYAAAAACGLIVMLHCGRDVAFPPDDDRATPSRIRRIIDSTAGLKLVATHMGGWQLWPEANISLVGADCWMETSFSISQMDPALAVEMIGRHSPGRVMFGTDSPWADQARELNHLANLGLTDEELSQIRSHTARRLLGL